MSQVQVSGTMKLRAVDMSRYMTPVPWCVVAHWSALGYSIAGACCHMRSVSSVHDVMRWPVRAPKCFSVVSKVWVILGLQLANTQDISGRFYAIACDSTSQLPSVMHKIWLLYSFSKITATEPADAVVYPTILYRPSQKSSSRPQVLNKQQPPPHPSVLLASAHGSGGVTQNNS